MVDVKKQIRDLPTATVISTGDWLVLETPEGGTFKTSTSTFLNKLDATDIIAGANIKTTVANNTVTISGIGIWYISQFSSTAISVLSIGKRYYNTTSNKIFTSDGSSWDTGITPSLDSLYVNTTEKVFYFYNGTTLVPTLTKVKTDKVFTVNYANINSVTNTPDLLKINTTSTSMLQFKVGSGFVSLSATTVNGDKFTLDTINNYDVAALADGTYNVYVTVSGVVILRSTSLYTQSTLPTTPVTDDVWLNTIVSPYILSTYSGSAWTSITEQFIPLGTATVASGALTTVSTFDYNKSYV